MTRKASCLSILVAVAAMTLTSATPTPGRESRTDLPPVVVAIVEPGGFNVLHSDFRLRASRRLGLLSGLPRRQVVTLPEGTWGEQLREIQSGPLGDMEPGVLYSLARTRIIGIWANDRAAVTNIMENSSHGTGTASSAAGLAHGTNPDAWLVLVPDVSEAAWQWLARQRWIDIVSTSYATLVSDEGCPSRRAIARIVDQGRLVFSAVGNGEQLGQASSPSGVPEAYQVGGVDEQGRTHLQPAQPYIATPNRPYETGDRFEAQAAAAGSLNGSRDFGGTSASAPSTAGRASALVQHARAILGSSGYRAGALARAKRGVELPRRGPLADGDLTGVELADVLHAVAIPAEPPSPLRYLIEGFGALNDDAIEHAKRILEGGAEIPDRTQEQMMHEQTEALRQLAMERC